MRCIPFCREETNRRRNVVVLSADGNTIDAVPVAVGALEMGMSVKRCAPDSVRQVAIDLPLPLTV